MNKTLDALFVVAFFILDRILQTLFPVDFELRRLFFVSNMGLVALMVVLHKRPLGEMLVIAFISGLVLDISHYGYFLMEAISFTFTLWVVRVWSNQVNESVLELAILSLLTIFIHESFVFALLRILSMTQLSVLNWFVYREFLTLVIHIPLILFILGLNHARLGLLNQREVSKQRAEDPLFMSLKKR